MKYHLLYLGCQMNQSDTERARSVIEGLGYEPTDNEEEADLLGIMACSVRQKAIDKVYAKIQKWNSWKNQRNLLTFVSGCILPVDRTRFLKLFDFFFHINELPQLPDIIRQYGIVTPASIDHIVPQESRSDRQKGFWHIAPRRSSAFNAYVPIQNGCDKFCSFCAVPYTRGREVSRPSQDVLDEVETLVEQGYKSITLLGQNVNSYGLDREKELSFPQLLRRIGRLGLHSGKDFWLYFTSPHPSDMSEELLHVIREYPCLARQIHLPLQSGDDRLLIRMNRHYTIDQYHQVVENIRSLLPQATLYTDIIVGFSGETEEQFENTRRALKEFRYNMAYIAMYSPRPGAKSSRWPDDVSHEEKKRRLHILSEELKKHSLMYNQGLVGKTLKVLAEGFDRKPGCLSGKTEGRIPVRFSSTDASMIGSFVDVKIGSAVPLSVEGDFVSSLTLPFLP